MDWFRLILIGFLNWSAFVSGDHDQQQPGAVSSLINLQKRIDYRTCLGRFDVHTDTIIQTEDSRKMGASFLTHLEAANRDECLRVCCETDRCDVFVFEEKFKGSCFLFQCGPPDDFRCRFASHANYSIAVLSIPLQRYKSVEQTPQPVVAPPPPAPHLSQHELELANLKTGRESFTNFRMPEMGNNNNNKNPGVVTTTAPQQLGQVTTKPVTTTAKPSVCGRFQFQCHSGECIAIYNACDGIPQCEDGSDETPACSSQAASSSAVSTNKKHNSQMEEPPLYRVNPQIPQQPPHRSDLNYQDRTRLQIQYPAKIYDNNNQVIGSGGGYNENNLNSAKYSQDMTGSIEKPPPLRNREEPGSAPRYYPSSSQGSRNPESPQMMGKEMAMQSNMIYNINDPQDNRQAVYEPHGRPLDYYSSGGAGGAAFRDKYYYPSNLEQQQQQQIHPIQPVDPLADGPVAYNNPSNGLNYLPTINKNNNWPISNNLPTANLNSQGQQQPQQSPQLPPVSPNTAPQSIPAMPPVAVAPPEITKSKTAKKPATEESSEEESQSNEEEGAVVRSTPKKTKGKSRGKHRKLDKGDDDVEEEGEQSQEKKGMPTFPPIYQQLKAIGSELDAEIVDHDGASDRPTGAVVSLVIGVFITAVLAIFIGCRMKTVGRRIRRTGKGPYAHDADFLVNGMYL